MKPDAFGQVVLGPETEQLGGLVLTDDRLAPQLMAKSPDADEFSQRTQSAMLVVPTVGDTATTIDPVIRLTPFGKVKEGGTNDTTTPGGSEFVCNKFPVIVAPVP